MCLLSIIIPTLNEENYLGLTLAKVLQQYRDKPPPEIIVVDAGSKDATYTIAQSFPEVRWISVPEFKGKKYASLNHGARLARGKFLLFLDADSLPPIAYDLIIKKALSQPETVGGAFEFSFNRTSGIYRFIQLVNRLRYRWRKRFYGDQGVFARKEAFDRVGGFPAKVLMETAYLCHNLQKVGKLVIAFPPMVTSARRFEQGGVRKVFLQDVRIWFWDLLGKDVQHFAREYWKANPSIK
ncbi:glycosyltransferase family 2 protein [Rapidithrix thailandica]|uniref:Glycosyltransferase family 2 protein n=1 Tax=Rapidithrix thailandica TaxID=413964 RepID=A0AAW9SCX8_9BACT